MNTPILAPDSLCQVALVVTNIETVARNYAHVFGVPMPVIRETGPADQTRIRYRGSPTPARAKLAFFQVGTLQLELIEPMGAPSTWRDGLETKGPGLHHIAFRVANSQETTRQLTALGATLVQTGDFGTGNYAYVDATQPLGAMIELLEFYPTPPQTPP